MNAVNKLRQRADLYEKDGKPGDLGYNVWGWRDIAREIRRVADEVEAESKETA